jgi:hypothetical protein
MALVADVELAALEPPRFAWAVSDDVADVARRFIFSLAETTGIILPQPTPEASQLYGQAALNAELVGRCILIGERIGNPRPYYHWYIDWRNGEIVVKDFWSDSIWPTERLRSTPRDRRPAEANIGAPNESTRRRSIATRDVVVEADHQRRTRGWFARMFQRRT